MDLIKKMDLNERPAPENKRKDIFKKSFSVEKS